MLISHKLLRWFSMFFIVGTSISSLIIFLETNEYVYSAALFIILISMLLALAGKFLTRSSACPKFLYLFYYFYLVNIAAMAGIIDNLRGRHHVTWDHIRKANN